MNFTALKQELSDRGYEDLSDARLGNFINQGRAELDNMYLWPYRVTTTTTGAPPVVLTDLGVIEDVVDTTNNMFPLAYRDRRTLQDAFTDLTQTGQPLYFWIDNGTVRTYPVGGSVVIRYYKRAPMLSTGSDTPLAPADYHMVIVDMAVRWAQKDGDAPDTLDGDITRQIGVMMEDLLGQQNQGPDGFQPGAGSASDDW